MTKKQLESAVESAFKRFGQNRQFNIMDLGTIHRAGMDAGQAGESIEDAIKAAVDQYAIT